jgi:hypothetical protein
VPEISDFLVGLEMSAICMVRDYVEFHFDGPIVRALSDPKGRLGELSWQFPERDALSAMRLYISKTLTGTELDEGVQLLLEFGADHISIPLDQESRPGPEALQFVPVDQQGVLDAAHNVGALAVTGQDASRRSLTGVLRSAGWISTRGEALNA